MTFILFFIIILVIELPSMNLAAVRFQADRRSDRDESTPGPPDTTHPDIIKKQKPILRGVETSSNITRDVPASLQTEQTLLKETVPEPSSGLLGQLTSTSGKIIHKRFSAREAPASVSERISTSLRLLVKHENGSQMTTHSTDEYRIQTPRVNNSTVPHQNTAGRSMRSIFKTPVTNQKMVSENSLSHGETTPTIKPENVMFRNGASRSSAAQDVASVSSSTTRDMKKSQGRTSQNPSQGSIVKIIGSSKAPKSDARRENDKPETYEQEAAKRILITLSTYPFYYQNISPAKVEAKPPVMKCLIGKCYHINWDPIATKKPDSRLRLFLTTEDDSIFPEQYF